MIYRFFPPIIVKETMPAGYNARNTLGYITIARDLGTQEKWVAVLCQEEWEMRFKNWIVTAIAFAFSDTIKRYVETKGHAVEAYVAHRWFGADLSEYEAREARSMTLGYREFRGYSEEQCRDRLVKARNAARNWAERPWNRWFIKRAMKWDASR